MRIEIDPTAANDPDAHSWLDRILHKVDDGWHVWDTTQADPNALAVTSWMRESTQRVHELFVASVQRGAWTLEPHGRRARVTTNPSAADELTPEHAARLAEQPLCVLVENRFSDGAFVRRIVEELDGALHSLWSLPTGPVHIDGPGGKGQMKLEVERRVQQKPYRVRLVAIVDSDRRHRTSNPSKEARQLDRYCDKNGLPCWILAKREAENYLPRVLLEARPDVGEEYRQRTHTWDRLTDDQKDFFDMKQGLPDVLSGVEHALFGELSEPDRVMLSSGFGERVHACWMVQNVPARQQLISRGQGDLELGMELIRSQV